MTAQKTMMAARPCANTIASAPTAYKISPTT